MAHHSDDTKTSAVRDDHAPVRGLTDAAGQASGGGAPVHLWNPDFCGDIDMRIAADGTWYYMGSPIGRPAMVRLFSSVLRKDEDGRTYLVTPVEKVGIVVDDAPFVAGSLVVDGDDADQRLRFTTNVGDTVVAGPDHPLRFVVEPETEGLKPYILVRGRLEALISRALVFELVERAVPRAQDGREELGLWSGGCFFPVNAASTGTGATQ